MVRDISIIVPVYNREHTLRKCLDSILRQTYDGWECMLIDDGSTDGSLAVCEEYAAEDSRFRVYHQENGGVSSARNKGLDQASFDYITFVDSDDYLHPDCLRRLREAMDDHDMSIGLLGKVSEKTELRYMIWPSKSVFIERGYENDFVEMDKVSLLNGPVCKLFRRDIINKNDIRFLPEVSYGEDTIFNYTYLLHIRSIRFLGEQLYFVSYTPGSLSDDCVKKYSLEQFLLLWEVRTRFFQAKNMMNERVRMRLIFLYCCHNWMGLAHIAFKRKELTISQRYTQLKCKIGRIDRKAVNNASDYPFWNRFLMKHPFLFLLYFELRHLLKK